MVSGNSHRCDCPYLIEIVINYRDEEMRVERTRVLLCALESVLTLSESERPVDLPFRTAST